VRVLALLVPPLEQPRSPLLPAGVFTTTLKLPAAGIIDDVMSAVTWELLTTVVARVAPLKTITEEETKWLPVAVSTKLGGSCENAMVAGEIELRLGLGRALPQRGFSVLHPGKSKSTTIIELTRTIRQEDDITRKGTDDSLF
ncbi:MAG TPA: hypothetical protein VNS88_11455, partial [Nitrospiraceae bacterium]|nr:hypothetical protein [Nitrospiraceae bacterium]